MDQEGQNQAWVDRSYKTDEWAHERVKQCIVHPTPELLNDPLTELAGHWLYHNKSAHQCYWNDSFAVAVACQLSLYLQRKAAWISINNGLNEYWEWTTHRGFDLLTLLQRLGAVDKDFQRPERESVYDRPPTKEVFQKIAEHFQLPTRYFGRSEQLSEFEVTQARRFNEETHFRTL